MSIAGVLDDGKLSDIRGKGGWAGAGVRSLPLETSKISDVKTDLG